MATHTDRTGRMTKTLILLASVGLLLGGAMGVAADPQERHKVERGPSLNAYADISVTYDTNSTGFNATSSKDLSNIVITYCDDTTEKLEFGDGNETYLHSNNSTIKSVTVKSGVSEETFASEACETEAVLTRT